MLQGILSKKAGIRTGVTFDPAKLSNASLSNGNLTVSQTGASGGDQVFNNLAKTSGKYYFEITYVTLAGSVNGGMIGVAVVGTTYGQFAGSTNSSVAYANGNLNEGGTNFFNNAARVQGDIIAIAVDLDNKSIWWKLVAGGKWNGNVANGDPALNINGVPVPAGSIIPYVVFGTNPSDVFTGNFGATAYSGNPPVGFGNWPAS